ncbi:MAG: altronate dehydratase family protein [Lachnospiraceae bacterium]|nr:altronate dehydratase family protein [Lachnospiraceae bacterium]
MSLLTIHPNDNVAVDLDNGHKVALKDIHEGENVIKYGFPIGHATENIKSGERVHTENLKTNLGEKLTYKWGRSFCHGHGEGGRSFCHGDATQEPGYHENEATFMGYVRENGEIGIRNDVWIVNTVGCVNKIAEKLAKITGAFSFPHPYGCSQLGDDQAVTQKILKGLVEHPNAGAVLVLGLGCENNNLKAFKEVLGQVNENRVKFLNVQDEDDEIEEGVRIIEELKAYADTFKRQPVPVSSLKIGLKCGGSDGFSGITANPLIGRVSDLFISKGASTVLTEVPEMFGAETILMDRCISKDIFDKTVDLINDFKDYYTRHNQVIYENPSPGNKAGGITTLEEKSLGCTQKGGSAPVVDVLDYGDRVIKNGLNLLNGPGNDMVAVTNLTAAGCHMILFSTGRGTPLGAPVPTVKIATNSALASKKKEWIDFNAGLILEGLDLTADLFTYLLEVAEGKETKNEQYGYREIAIFKDGVTL